jgi:hypothetical protein
MLDTFIRKATPIILALFMTALTVGTSFAQDGEAAPVSSGLTLAVLMLGIIAITAIFILTWGRSAPDNTD